MSRLPVLAIVLALGVGPSSSILCHVWCAADNRPPECHETLASVVAADCCESPGLTAVFGTESRQEAVSAGLEAGAVRHRVEEPAISARVNHRHEPRGAHSNSLVTVLRI